jgi:hypothetical protein
MRTLVVTNTASADLTGNRPFGPNHTVVVLNATGTSEILQSSDAVGGTYTTIATVGAGESAEVEINNPFLRLASAGFLILLGN